jgi:SAM-dependent methyltransferase
MTDVVNVEQARAWNSGDGEHWTEHEDRYNAAVEPYDEHLLAAARISPGDDVLDIGCGCGISTRQAARRAAPGHVLGVDLSSRMLDRARQRAGEQGLTNVSFEQADAQVHPFDTRRFDVVISRFGAMFFADPVAAFANIARTMRPGGRLALLAWQPLDRNPWVARIRDDLAAGRQLPRPSPGQPGPFGLADADMVRDLLVAAGFAEPAVAAASEPMRLGSDAEDAFRFVSGMGVARGLLQDLDDATAAEALRTLRADLVAHQTVNGVVFDSSAWVITAHIP